MNLESPPVDVWFHTWLGTDSQTMSLGFWAFQSHGLASGRLSLMMARGPWAMPGMYPTISVSLSKWFQPKVWGLEVLSWNWSHEPIWDSTDQTEDMYKLMELIRGRVNTARATWTENGEELILSYLKVLLTEEWGLKRQSQKVVPLGWVNQVSSSALFFLTCGQVSKRIWYNFL